MTLATIVVCRRRRRRQNKKQGSVLTRFSFRGQPPRQAPVRPPALRGLGSGRVGLVPQATPGGRAGGSPRQRRLAGWPTDRGLVGPWEWEGPVWWKGWDEASGLLGGVSVWLDWQVGDDKAKARASFAGHVLISLVALVVAHTGRTHLRQGNVDSSNNNATSERFKKFFQFRTLEISRTNRAKVVAFYRMYQKYQTAYM
ncbi:uncharacterized protein BKA78DRAFT_309663 [Phyllosticta capitalensis]|uniref:uncharacterized protein n=1 Tax=Phyllosticta capitalensis TaxID=121624 RepID=UPI00313026AE